MQSLIIQQADILTHIAKIKYSIATQTDLTTSFPVFKKRDDLTSCFDFLPTVLCNIILEYACNEHDVKCRVSFASYDHTPYAITMIKCFANSLSINVEIILTTNVNIINIQSVFMDTEEYYHLYKHPCAQLCFIRDCGQNFIDHKCETLSNAYKKKCEQVVPTTNLLDYLTIIKYMYDLLHKQKVM